MIQRDGFFGKCTVNKLKKVQKPKQNIFFGVAKSRYKIQGVSFEI